MRSKIRATLMWLRNQRWLVPAGTVVTLLSAGIVGAIPILLAPSTGWRWVAVFLSPTVGFVTVVVAMEAVHLVRRVLVARKLIPEQLPPDEGTGGEEAALIRAMHDPREPDTTTFSPPRASHSLTGTLLPR